MASVFWTGHGSVYSTSVVQLNHLVFIRKLTFDRWSMFWHRSVYRSFGSHSEVILKHFGVKRSSNVYRTLTAFNIFGLSAVMHSLVSWKYGNKCAWGRSMAYWFFQPAAFTLEGIVQACWSRFRKQNLKKQGISRIIDVSSQVVGYVWVCTFLMWVDPKRHYPLRNCLP